MREFWDERADEDAFYFVDNRLEYGDPDLVSFWRGGAEDLQAILGALGVDISPSDQVVEIGCGVGRITRALAARAGSLRALDVSPRMLRLAREHNAELTNVEWIQGDGRSLAGIDSASADACFSHVVFQHIPDPKVTLGYVEEMGRVLRPGGWSAFQISNQPALHRPRPLGERLLSLPGRLRKRRPRGQGHAAWLGSAVELGELRAAAERGQLEVERIQGEGTQWCLVLLRRRP